MTSTTSRRALWPLLLVLAGLPGCLAAGAAAAGAGTGIYLTTRGAEAVVNGSVEDVEKRARAVLESEGVPVSDYQTEDGGARRELQGKKGDLEVSVSMARQSDETTKTEVSARKNLAVWDKEYAQQLLDKIVKRS